jgi:3-deoxy-D-manno-octulosonic-acid transferase
VITRIAYTFILILLAPFFLYGLYKPRANKPSFGSRWKEHFGITPKLNNSKPPIWIHAVSVGESIAATPLIKSIKQQFPDIPIVVTTTTSTGAEQIAKLGNLVEHRYMPLDFGFAIKRFIATIRPTQLLIIETELWPNTLHCVNAAGVPIKIINARLSEKSCRNYAKVLPLFRHISSNITQILCQSEKDAGRFAQLGVPEDKLFVTGSIKFDISISDMDKDNAKELREKLGSQRPIWIAASTHKGEDEIVLSAHKTLLKSQPNALLILVPRHPERFEQVYTLCQSEGFLTKRRTNNPCCSELYESQVYLGDTMGEMLTLIGAADVCFMGGSLLGDKVGGHNVLEPLALNVPTITGNSYYNFQEIVDDLHEQKAITVIHSPSDLCNAVATLLKIKKTEVPLLARSPGPIAKTINQVFKNYD